jgi:hypothetical protein
MTSFCTRAEEYFAALELINLELSISPDLNYKVSCIKEQPQSEEFTILKWLLKACL